jgi:hypothetical protein
MRSEAPPPVANKSSSKPRRRLNGEGRHPRTGEKGVTEYIRTYLIRNQIRLKIYIYIRILYVQRTRCVLDLIPVLVLTFSIRIDGNLIQSVIGFFRAYY